MICLAWGGTSDGRFTLTLAYHLIVFNTPYVLVMVMCIVIDD